MKFYPPTPLRLINVRKGTSAKGNPYAFVTLADEATFENSTFMLHNEQSPDMLLPHKRYAVELNQETSQGNNFFSVSLTPEHDKQEKPGK